MKSITPNGVQPEDRLTSIDTLRGLALFGVLLVNLVSEFRVSIFQQFLPKDGPSPLQDRIVETFVSLALEMKAFALFSFIFGIGLAVQFERLSRLGNAYLLLIRRLVVLLILGLIHLLFIWNGDILTEYAIAGLLVLPFLSAPSRVIAAGFIMALAFYVTMPMMSLPISWPDLDTLQRHVAQANIAYTKGNLVDVWRFSIHELPLLLPLHIWIFPRTIALFLFGIFVWRAGVLQRQEQYRKLMLTVACGGIVAGAAMTTASAAGTLAQWGTFGTVLAGLTSVVLAAGYGATVLALVRHPVAGRVLQVFAPMGRMAFTNYIMQSVIFGFIFFGYGLGYFGQLGAAQTLLIGVAVYSMQALLSSWWLSRYHYGPLEWLWRTLMYGVKQSMR